MRHSALRRGLVWSLGGMGALLVLALGPTGGGMKPARKYRTTLLPRYLFLNGCKDGRRNHYHLKRAAFHVGQEGGDLFDAYFSFDEVGDKFSLVKGSFWMCNNGMSQNNCEFLGTYKWSVGLCRLMLSKKMPWTNVYDRTRPPVTHCPIPAGEYSVENATVDFDAVEVIMGRLTNVADNVYIGDLEILDQKGELYFCVRAGVRLIRMRKLITKP